VFDVKKVFLPNQTKQHQPLSFKVLTQLKLAGPTKDILTREKVFF